MGVYTSLFTLIWISVYTLPQFNDIIHIDKQVSTMQVLIVYFIVTVANALHSWSYYELIELTGNVWIFTFVVMEILTICIGGNRYFTRLESYSSLCYKPCLVLS